MTDLIPAARPVPSPEDRMAAARTDTPPTTDPAPTHPGRSFRTWMSDTDRDQLDARAATAEQERDEAQDDRDFAREQAKAMYETLKKIERERNEALEARDVARQTADFRQGVIDRHRQELGAAGEVLAVVRDAQERVERALARYDTQPGQTPDEPDDTDPDAVQNLLDDATRAFADASTSSERVEVIRDLLAGWYAAWPASAVTDEHEGIAHQLVALVYAAEARVSPPSSVPPRRAQEPSAADLLRQAAAGRREYAKGIPEKAEPLELQAHTLEAAACVVEGDLSPLYDWLPSWKWTDEMHARLHDGREPS